MTYDEEHARIVEALRRRGWSREDALEEADRLMAERTARREAEVFKA